MVVESLTAAFERHAPILRASAGAAEPEAAQGIERTLFPLAREVVLTKAPGDRAATPESIARAAGPAASRAHRVKSVAKALRLAARLVPADGVVVVAGSLYLVGDVLKRRRV